MHNEDIQIVKFLMDCKVDKNHQNKYGKSPCDYAIKSQNKEMIKLYFEMDAQTKVSELIDKNKKLTLEFTEEKSTLNREIVILKTHNKRLFDDNLVLEHENKELVSSNKKLKLSNDTLTKAMRK